MAIRERAKALFRPRSRSDKDKDSQLSQTSSKASERERWPSNVYKPGEPMPRPKYRAIPKKEHREKLEAFSFAEAWRRKSFQSQHSPMGTRLPSRRNSYRNASRNASRRSSWISIGKRSFSGKSSDGRTNSITSGETEKSTVKHKEHMGAAIPTTLQTETEAEGDDDVGNVGLSRVQSKEQRYQPLKASGPPQAASNSGPSGEMNHLTKTLSTAHDHQPFTEEQLTLALQKSHLGTDRSHLTVPTQG